LGAGKAVIASLLKTVSALPETQKVKPVKPIFSEAYEALIGCFAPSEEDFMASIRPTLLLFADWKQSIAMKTWKESRRGQVRNDLLNFS